MSRLDIKTPSRAQTVVEGLYRDVERRIAASPPGLCPVEMSLSFLQLCHAQTCGKCVPCRIGLGQLTKLISQVLDGTANMGTVRIIEKTARSIVDTADCAIGRDAARLVVDGLEGFRDDYEEHVQHHRCLASLQNPVPCVALCPAGVDIPGYMALVGAGRYADAVRLIRKDNPMPTACAYICEHPCEARCRRNMIDDPINIRGLKRYAVNHAGVVPNPPCAPATGKTVAIVGGGPSGLSCAYYLALMGHKVTIFEECSKLGGMLRYGIPSYRFPREKLDAEIDSILSLGIEVRTNVRIGRDIWLEELEKQYDCIYIAIGAHQDKKTGIPGEDSRNVISAVEMLKAIGDDVMPDFTGKQVVVIGGGNVAMDVTRSSIRLGASKVSCVYRRRLEDMTALPDEVAGATAEGAEMITLAAPVRIEADDDGVASARSSPRSSAMWTAPGVPSPTRPLWTRCASRRISSWWPSARASRFRALTRPACPLPAAAVSWLLCPARSATWTTCSPEATASPGLLPLFAPLPPVRWQPPTSTSTWAITMRSGWTWISRLPGSITARPTGASTPPSVKPVSASATLRTSSAV